MDKLLELADTKPTEYLVCRALLGHSWNENRGTVVEDGGMYLWAVPCYRCTTVRTIRINWDGERKGNSYKWPDGYKFEGYSWLDKTALGRLRVVAIQRLIAKE